MPKHYRPVPAAVFLPPAAEEVPDLAFWTPSDKHLVLEFVAPRLQRTPALVIHEEMNR